MRAMLRSPWPLFGIGLAFSVLGTVVTLIRPGSNWLDLSQSFPIFGGLLLAVLSPVIQGAASDAEVRRRLKSGLRWVTAWVTLLYTWSALNRLVWPLLDPLFGSPDSLWRTVALLGMLFVGLGLPIFFAAPLAEGIRRIAAWLGEA